jgi:DNA-damage-inducible protein D
MSINDESLPVQGDDFHLARIWHERRLRRQGAEATVDAIVHLEVFTSDGMQRPEKWADTETLLRIIQSIPSPKAEPFKQWLARVGVERLEEMENPELAADRIRRLYKQRGYSDEWFDQRMQGIVVRDDLPTEWRERGAEEGREFAILTDILHRGAFDVSTDEHKGVKQLKKRDNLRDNMMTLELALTMLSEATSTALHQAHDSQGFTPLQ